MAEIIPFEYVSSHCGTLYLSEIAKPAEPVNGQDERRIRAEYTAILQKQLASGNNGIVKTKYLTFTIEADNLKTARARLSRIGLDLLV